MKSAHTPTPKKNFNAYIWQMNDGNWHIDQRTNWRLNGYDVMPDYGAGFETREAALAWLAKSEAQ